MSSEIAPDPQADNPNEPVQPIVLTPVNNKGSNDGNLVSRKGFFSTLSILFAGWFFGNLILFAVLGLGTITFASSTGLVKVPFLTKYFFGEGQTNQTYVDSYSLHNGEEKIDKLQKLSSGETIDSLVFYEDEINALLAKQAIENSSFPIVWEGVRLQEGGFFFNGRLKETNAPVRIEGSVKINGLSGEVQITKAVYGKVAIPSFIATNIVESQLSTIGLSLGNNQIPARAVELSNGILKLIDVTEAN